MTDPELLSWIERGQLVAALLVAIGVAGEFAGSFIARPVTKRIEAQRQLEAQREKRETADAQEKAAKAQLELNQWLAKKASYQQADPKDFETLKELPKGSAEILFKQDNGEALMYAQSILGALKTVGWSVPAMASPTRNHPMPGNETTPIIGTYLIVKSCPPAKEAFEPDFFTHSRVGILMRAIRTGGCISDPNLSDNTVRIVVGEPVKGPA